MPMTRHEYFQKRLRELGLFDQSADYNGMLGRAVEELSATFAGQHHSGHSAALTLVTFHNLMAEWEATGGGTKPLPPNPSPRS
jgi:hypothetical protein